MVYIRTKRLFMARQSTTFTKPHNDWLNEQVENLEYSGKSELVNDLIRQARNQQAQIDWIRHKIERAEKSGFTSNNQEEILTKAKATLHGWLQVKSRSKLNPYRERDYLLNSSGLVSIVI